jgi:hypothetical protein
VLCQTYIVCLALFSSIAHAAVNLPAVCADESALAKADCPAAAYAYNYAADQSLVKASNLWQRYLTATGTVLACPSDIAPGSVTCPTARTVIDKALLAQAPAETFAVTASWPAPQSYTDGTPLGATDLIGYTVSWRRADSDVWTDVDTVLLSQPLTLPMTKVCIRVIARTAAAQSEPTAEVCTEPRPKTPESPAQVTVTFASP